MRNRLGIQIATDQMNGRDFELLISLSHFGAQTPKGETMGSEVLSASPLAAAQTGTSYTHIAFNFAFNIVIIF